MPKIKVIITIPDYEYEEWDEFQKYGIDAVEKSLREDISHRLRQDFVRHFDIDIEKED